MSTPYDREFIKTTAGPDEVVELDFPGRCDLTRISLVRVGAGNVKANVYNRKFVGATHAIIRIEDVAGGGVRIVLSDDAADFNDVKVGDLVTVAGNSVGGYNVAHRVLVIDSSTEPRFIETDQAFTADGAGGTAKLDIPALEQELQRVIPEIDGASPQLIIPTGTGDTATYVNQDPLPNVNIGIKRKLYMKFEDAATYKIAISAVLGVAGEG